MTTVDIRYNGVVGALGEYEVHRTAIQVFADKNRVVGFVNSLSIQGDTISLVISGYGRAPQTVASLVITN